ncbi:hypothetical protein KAT92_05315 [Candidatus Babeliales bacterium]|nr:hypothetical protein [Candidatus Babeliales bacterium]
MSDRRHTELWQCLDTLRKEVEDLDDCELTDMIGVAATELHDRGYSGADLIDIIKGTGGY